jgi:ribosomal protein S18 acetylase RimI-like enzyme
MQIYTLAEEDFPQVIKLANKLNGQGYLDARKMKQVFLKGLSKGLNCNYVAYEQERGSRLIGLRLAYAPGNWQIDKWCTVKAWGVPPDKVCYLKSNMVEEDYWGRGIGTILLNKTISTVKEMGGVAAIAHVWVESPSGTAIKYFTEAGGHFIKLHYNRWLEDCITSDYRCIHHGDNCTCSAVEMIIYFGEQE